MLQQSRETNNTAMSKKGQDNSNTRIYSALWERIVAALDTGSTGEIAAKVGVAASSVSEWKNGRRLPPLDHLMTIAEISGVTVDWLLTGRDRHSGGKAGGEEGGGLVRSFLLTCVPDEVAAKIRAKAESQKRPLQEVLIETIEIGVLAEPLAEKANEFSAYYVAKLKQGLAPATPRGRKRKGKEAKAPATE